MVNPNPMKCLYRLELEELARSRGSIKSSTSPMPIAPWRSNIEKTANYYGVNLAESSWHNLGHSSSKE